MSVTRSNPSLSPSHMQVFSWRAFWGNARTRLLLCSQHLPSGFRAGGGREEGAPLVDDVAWRCHPSPITSPGEDRSQGHSWAPGSRGWNYPPPGQEAEPARSQTPWHRSPSRVCTPQGQPRSLAQGCTNLSMPVIYRNHFRSLGWKTSSVKVAMMYSLKRLFEFR